MSGILRDKTMADRFMYIPNYEIGQTTNTLKNTLVQNILKSQYFYSVALSLVPGPNNQSFSRENKFSSFNKFSEFAFTTCF